MFEMDQTTKGMLFVKTRKNMFSEVTRQYVLGTEERYVTREEYLKGCGINLGRMIIKNNGKKR